MFEQKYDSITRTINAQKKKIKTAVEPWTNKESRPVEVQKLKYRWGVKSGLIYDFSQWDTGKLPLGSPTHGSQVGFGIRDIVPHFDFMVSPIASKLLTPNSRNELGVITWEDFTIKVDENIKPSNPTGEVVGWRKRGIPSSESAA